MPKRKQKREGRSEEKRRAEDTSSFYILLETDLRGEASPGQTVLCRYILTGTDSQV